jgi:hypothetical protein
MTESTRLGGHPLRTKPPQTRPFKNLPVKLNAEACIAILNRLDPEITVTDVAAARQSFDLDRVDMMLEYTELSLSDKMIFKSALSEFGILPRGRRTAINRF